jgi:hypothetical protein
VRHLLKVSATPRFLAIFCAAASAGAGCGPDAPPPPAALDSCRAGWQPLTTSRPFFPARNLAVHDGELIYDGDGVTPDGAITTQIEALPMTGGMPRVVTTGSVWSLWVEGDQVFYAMGADLRVVPAAGGTSSLVVSGAPAPAPDIFAHLLTPTTFVWARFEYGGGGTSSEIWAVARGGGAARLLGVVTDSGLVERMTLAGDDVLVAGQAGRASAVPLAGGQTRRLASAGYQTAGLEAEGLYGYDTRTPVDPAVQRFFMELAPADGSAARPFWPEVPPRVLPDHLWADGEGGFLVSASEDFDDGRSHRSFFQLDSQGQATRTACDGDPTVDDYVTVRPVFTPDAVFFIDEELGGARATWRIVKIPRSRGQ